MSPELFNTLVEQRTEKIRAVLGQKAGEYASDTDRLHNFKRAADLMRCTPEEALLGFLTKHIVSVIDMIKADRDFHPEVIDEKIGDCINYFILLEALMKERFIYAS